MTTSCLHLIMSLWLIGAAGEGVPAGSAVEAASQAPLGDTITLTSGKVLLGFQVIRETVSHYVVEIIPAQQTLRLPKSQVESVVYDDIDPRISPPDRAPTPSETEPVLLTGQQMEIRLMDALSKDISEPEFRIESIDYLQVLNEVSRRSGVRIRVDVTVMGIPPEQRVWTHPVAQGSNGMVLINALIRAFPELRVVYQEDDVLVTKRTERPAGSPPAADRASPQRD